MKKIIVSIFVLLFASSSLFSQDKHTFAYGDDSFLLNGKPFQIISGEMHFARVPQEYWKHRLEMAKAMGMNTICTYVFWNYHEPQPGVYNFEGNADVAEFVRTAQEVGLWVIIRPSPYACAEWEFGGYPWWLLNEKDIEVRSQDPIFLELSEKYFQALAQEIAPLQITNGGPIIMVQVENEYGFYGNDKEYLNINKNMMRDAGIDVPLFTCDGTGEIKEGHLPGLLPALNGTLDVTLVKNLVNKYNFNRGPYFISEWYPAWFDHWGEVHKTVPFEDFIDDYKTVLDSGLSINMYMVHGGSTRGFWNGANMPPFRPQTSSYDYDAPIDEAGNATPKFYAFRNVIENHIGEKLPEVPQKNKTIAIKKTELTHVAKLYDNLPEPIFSENLKTFEEINQGYGFVMYRNIMKEEGRGFLKVFDVRDYAVVLVNGRRVGTLDRRLEQDSLFIRRIKQGDTLDILVENMGRINYGSFLNDNKKGITRKVEFNQTELKNWMIYSLPMTEMPEFNPALQESNRSPVFRKATFDIDEIGDTYIDMSNFGKGFVWLNGHNLGRFWNIGPTQTVYVPAPWLKYKDNELIIFDELKYNEIFFQTLEEPILDQASVIDLKSNNWVDSLNRCWLAFHVRDTNSHIRYTLDGSVPDENSNIYSSPIMIEKESVVFVRAENETFMQKEDMIINVSPSISTGKKAKYNSEYSRNYKSKHKRTLVNGIIGSLNYRDGFWQGFRGNDIDVVIDLGKKEKINHIKTNFLKDIGAWIFLPTEVEIYISNNGKKFTKLETNYNGDNSADGIIKIESASVDMPKTVRARYVKVVAKSMGKCPEGHPGEGSDAWLFIDEVIVK